MLKQVTANNFGKKKTERKKGCDKEIENGMMNQIKNWELKVTMLKKKEEKEKEEEKMQKE